MKNEYDRADIEIYMEAQVKKERLLIFDLDGTLFDTGDVNYHSYRQALSDYGVSLERDAYLNEYNGRHYKDFLPLLLENDEQVEAVHEHKKLLYGENLFRARENTHLFELIEAMAERCHIALVTTANKKNTNEILECFDKKRCFEYILTGEDIKKVKPDPAGFIMAMEHFGISADHTVIYEDSRTGIEAALASGASVYRALGF